MWCLLMLIQGGTAAMLLAAVEKLINSEWGASTHRYDELLLCRLATRWLGLLDRLAIGFGGGMRWKPSVMISGEKGEGNFYRKALMQISLLSK
ncbi:hypothetical protein NPIL_148961 [Nephila pilipes]|uniref:Uncharacterized protein n=1 Tax=Nephila pilipes TaxID=299642 RepID=A0A8X6PWW9_NEPPI|nr:hypothetical protein NPIL_148961 [Nephila pilipes]